MKYYILHNHHDETSRNFIANLPKAKKGDEYIVIDWYEDEEARFKYTGPPASAFPSVCWMDDKDNYFMARMPANWQEVTFIQSAANAEEAHEKLSSCIQDIEYVGGVYRPELERLTKEYPEYFKDKEKVEAFIETSKQKLEEKTAPEDKDLSDSEKIAKQREKKAKEKEEKKAGIKSKLAFGYHSLMDKFNPETPSSFIS